MNFLTDPVTVFFVEFSSSPIKTSFYIVYIVYHFNSLIILGTMFIAYVLWNEQFPFPDKQATITICSVLFCRESPEVVENEIFSVKCLTFQQL